MLAAAVVLGLFAVLIATFMLRPAATPAPTVSSAVVAAAVPFTFGDKITADKLKLVDLPATAAPEGAYHTVAAAIGDGKRVAQRSIAVNEVVVPAAVSPEGARLSNVGVIAPSMRAVSVNVNEGTDVGGLVAPGDHVDVFVTRTPPEHAPRTDVAISEHAVEAISAAGAASRGITQSPAPAVSAARSGPHASGPALTLSRTEGGKPDPVTDLLVQDVRVLALGQNTGVNSSKTDLVKTATLEVSPEQAAKLMLGQQAGTLTLALRGASDDEHTALASLHTQDLHDGPALRVSTAPRRVRGPRRGTTTALGSTIQIYRGGAATSYSVPGQ